MRSSGGRARYVAGTVAAVSLGLWVFTQFFGALTVQALVLRQMQVPPSSELVADIDALRGDHPTHYCNAVAVAPLVVRLEFGHICGPLCGRGRTDYFVWLPWGHYRFILGKSGSRSAA